MPADSNHGSQFQLLPSLIKVRPKDLGHVFVLIIGLLDIFDARAVDDLVAYVNLDQVFQDPSAIVIVVLVAFDERPAVHVADVGFPVGSQQIEPANVLAKPERNLPGVDLLTGSQVDRVPNFLAVRGSFDYSI